MRIDPAGRNESALLQPGQPVHWGPAADAPTFLPPDESITDPDVPTGRAARGSQPSVTSPRAKSDSVLTSAPKPKQAAAAPVAAPVAAQTPVVQPPFIQFEGGASFDPLALPLPPELAPTIYDWLRRLALQNDLDGADRLLRDALADLTSSLSVMIIYKGDEGLYTLGASDELPKDVSPIAAVGKARRAIVSTHTAYVPIATATDTIAVIALARNPRQQAFTMIDNVTMAAIARECAAIMHHLVVQHSQRRAEAEHDKKGLYRAEALDSHRRRGHEGVITELSPGWVKRTYQVLIVAVIAAVAFAYFIHVPTYSSGTGVVIFDGTPITSPAAGTVEEVYVQSAQEVHKGDVLVKLKADKEEADLAQARREHEALQQQYLIDNSDETLKKQLITAQGQRKRAEDALEQKTVRATADGTVSDIRIRAGSALEFGAPILTIVAPGTEPELWAYLPGSDRPRLHPGQTLQIELTGYQKTREQATIYEVGRSVIAAGEAKRPLGPEVADSLKLAQDGSYVLVKAKLPKRTFRVKGATYNYHPGMPAKTEVRVEAKRFIVTLLPSIEKYVD